jgi:hypothetical protein
MTKAYISEYEFLGSADGGMAPQISQEPPIASQVVDYTSGVTASNAFSSQTKYIAISVDSICSFLVGSNPTATTSNFRLAADSILFVGVGPSQKISFITNT